jgi:hypothetical protein
MSSGPRATVGDRPPGTPEDGLGFDGSTVSPAARDPSEPPPLAPLEPDHFVARVDVALRVVALVVLAGLTGFAGWLVTLAWKMVADAWAGRVPLDTSLLGIILCLAAFCPVIRKMWLAARRGVEPAVERKEIAAIESRAFLEAVERHDRLRMDAQRLAAEEAGGVVHAERREEAEDPRLDEPSDRGEQARIADRMNEREDPG